MKGITLGILKLENKACCMVRSINKTALIYTPFSWFSSRTIDFRSNEVKVKGITVYFAWCRRWRYGQEFLKISILKYLEHISISNIISNWLWADNRLHHKQPYHLIYIKWLLTTVLGIFIFSFTYLWFHWLEGSLLSWNVNYKDDIKIRDKLEMSQFATLG